jgi:D-tagatose-1,6-bisphosphate aldolase subunit GatZ/KbaZ
MIIGEKIDNSIIREAAEKSKKPVINFIVEKLKILTNQENKNFTLLAVCPNSRNVVIAAIRSAKRAGAPVLFATTLNQVDIDGGYTYWNQDDLTRIIREESYRVGYEGPVIVCVDHGGPWLKDIQAIERWSLGKSINCIKESFEASITAQYDLIHIDPTVDIFNKNIAIETVVERTVELIEHVENFRKKKGKKPISYEVGTEEVHGGLVDIDVFSRFLLLLKKGLKKKNLEYVWPIFIVAKVGTDLHTSEFDPAAGEKVVSIARKYDSLIKGHYTDFVSNPKEYPLSGIGAANVGPEFTVLEYDGLKELNTLENKLYKENRIGCKSNFIEVLKKEVLVSNRWRKWLNNSEKDLNSLPEKRKEWIIKTSARYVLAKPEVEKARQTLYRNLENNGVDSNNWVLMNIEKGMDKYFRDFNLINLTEKINSLL